MMTKTKKKPAEKTLREKLLALGQPKKIEVDLPFDIYARPCRGADREIMKKLFVEDKDSPDSWERLMVIGVCDAEGNRVFTEADIPDLENFPLFTKVAIGHAVMDANGLSAESVEDAKGN